LSIPIWEDSVDFAAGNFTSGVRKIKKAEKEGRCHHIISLRNALWCYRRGKGLYNRGPVAQNNGNPNK
jgi:hypothetical protein